MSDAAWSRVTFTVRSVRPRWLIFQFVELVADADIETKRVDMQFPRFLPGPSASATRLRFARGDIVCGTVLWSPIWRPGNQLSVDAVMQRLSQFER
jgi:hypothetical protein